MVADIPGQHKYFGARQICKRLLGVKEHLDDDFHKYWGISSHSDPLFHSRIYILTTLLLK